jgi:hypothetical protein
MTDVQDTISPRSLDDITGAVVDAAVKIHRALQVGLLIKFGGATLKEGLQRIVNNLQPTASPHLRVNRSWTGSRAAHSASPAPPRDSLTLRPLPPPPRPG